MQIFDFLTRQELKDWLDIDGHGQNNIVDAITVSACAMVENYLDRRIVTRKYIEEYETRGTSPIILRNYPAYAIDSLYLDSEHDFGSDSLIPTDDYYLDRDMGAVKGKSGYSFGIGIDRAKVTYWAGLTAFNVISGQNDKIDITESGGSAVAVTVPAAVYYAESLSAAVQTALNDSGDLSGEYTVSYSHRTKKFTIGSDVAYTLHWSNGDNQAQNIGALMGFEQGKDSVEAETHASVATVIGVPEDIRLATLKLAQRLYDHNKHGGDTQEKSSEKFSTQGGGTITFRGGELPTDVKMILQIYKRKL